MTASGTIPEVGRTIAVDPSIPPGSIIRIDGKAYIAEDRGGAIKGNIIDVFAGTEAEATLLGTHQAEIYIKTGGENQ